MMYFGYIGRRRAHPTWIVFGRMNLRPEEHFGSMRALITGLSGNDGDQHFGQ